jgi:hypothetical protein
MFSTMCVWLGGWRSVRLENKYKIYVIWLRRKMRG